MMKQYTPELSHGTDPKIQDYMLYAFSADIGFGKAYPS